MYQSGRTENTFLSGLKIDFCISPARTDNRFCAQSGRRTDNSNYRSIPRPG